MSSLAIIIPAHNEERRIEKTINSYITYFDNLIKYGEINIVDFIIVLNACSDRTKEIVIRYKQKNIKILEFERGGKGFAVIEGFKHALEDDYNYIGFVDADMSTTPQEFYRLILKIGDSDGVIASRYIKGAKLTPKNTLPRIMASRLYNFFIRSVLLIPYRDTQCGAKIFKRETLKKIINKLGMTRWAFDIEILYLINKLGLKLTEVPTVWSNKDYSKINFWKVGPWMTLAIIRLRILKSPFKKMVRIYDKLIKVFKHPE